MILRAARELALDLDRSILVGDKESDMLAARSAGVRYPVLLGGDDCDGCWESVRTLRQVLAVLDRVR
jgi:histidinol phosphatase-like enzyme